MKSKFEIRELVKNNPSLEKSLFARGYLITNNNCLDEKEIPFSNIWWKKEKIGNYCFWHDERLKMFSFCYDNRAFFILGHAYNPVSLFYQEEDIIKEIAKAPDNKSMFSIEMNLTGIYMMGYVENDSITFWGDCSCKLAVYYGVINEFQYISSHSSLISDVTGIIEDSYITDLKNYRHFKWFGNVLPGNLSPYKEVKRAVPNFYYVMDGSIVRHFRFYPMVPLKTVTTDEEYNAVVEQFANILLNNIELINKKWPNRTAISLTGGKDSRTTLAATKKYKDRMICFSYSSKPEEYVDVIAAKEIAEKHGYKHLYYEIPYYDTNESKILAEIIAYNMGNTDYLKDNENRKRLYLLNTNDFDVEVKSWFSEIGRAYQYKKYSKKKFPYKPRPRHLTTLYKFFSYERFLVRKTDNVFRDYIYNFVSCEDLGLMQDWTVMWGWEFDESANEGIHLTSEHLISHEITIPFNCRLMADLMLKTPLEKRVKDEFHTDVIRYLYPELLENENVVNAAHTSRRARFEKYYYEINTRLPF